MALQLKNSVICQKTLKTKQKEKTPNWNSTEFLCRQKASLLCFLHTKSTFSKFYSTQLVELSEKPDLPEPPVVQVWLLVFCEGT